MSWPTTGKPDQRYLQHDLTHCVVGQTRWAHVGQGPRTARGWTGACNVREQPPTPLGTTPASPPSYCWRTTTASTTQRRTSAPSCGAAGSLRPGRERLARFNASSGYCFTTPRAAGRNAGCSFPVHLVLSLPVRKPVYAGRANPTQVTFSVLPIWGPTFSGDGNRPSQGHTSRTRCCRPKSPTLREVGSGVVRAPRALSSPRMELTTSQHWDGRV